MLLVAAASVAVMCFPTMHTGFPAAVVADDVVCILAADVMVVLVVDTVCRAAFVVDVHVTCVVAAGVMVVLVVDAVGRAPLVLPVVARCVLVVDMLVALVLEFLDPTILACASLVAFHAILAAATRESMTPLGVPVVLAADAKGGQ